MTTKNSLAEGWGVLKNDTDPVVDPTMKWGDLSGWGKFSAGLQGITGLAGLAQSYMQWKEANRINTHNIKRDTLQSDNDAETIRERQRTSTSLGAQLGGHGQGSEGYNNIMNNINYAKGMSDA